jgi:very-short-patch-repair endonuclease
MGSRRSLSPTLDERIAARAGTQHGVITTAQLYEAGASRSSISRRVRSGRLTKLYRGVHLVGPFALEWTREMAAVLVGGPDAVVSHCSALPLWGLGGETRPATTAVAQLARLSTDPVHVSATRGSSGRTSGICLHRVSDLPPTDYTRRFGVPVTTPARTILDSASILGMTELERVVARAEREGLVKRNALAELVARSRGRPGVRALRYLLSLEGGPAFTRSAAEDRFLALARKARLPAPNANVRFGPYELDFFWPDHKVAVEIDGFRHHSSRPRHEGDRRKDTWLRSRGVTLLRLTWKQITTDGTATVVQVGQVLALAARAEQVASP